MCADLHVSKDPYRLDPRIRNVDNITLGAWLDQPEVAATARVKMAVMTDIHAMFGVELDEMPLSSLMYTAATCGESSKMPCPG